MSGMGPEDPLKEGETEETEEEFAARELAAHRRIDFLEEQSRQLEKGEKQLEDVTCEKIKLELRLRELETRGIPAGETTHLTPSEPSSPFGTEKEGMNVIVARMQQQMTEQMMQFEHDLRTELLQSISDVSARGQGCVPSTSSPVSSAGLQFPPVTVTSASSGGASAPFVHEPSSLGMFPPFDLGAPMGFQSSSQDVNVPLFATSRGFAGVAVPPVPATSSGFRFGSRGFASVSGSSGAGSMTSGLAGSSLSGVTSAVAPQGIAYGRSGLPSGPSGFAGQAGAATSSSWSPFLWPAAIPEPLGSLRFGMPARVLAESPFGVTPADYGAFALVTAVASALLPGSSSIVVV